MPRDSESQGVLQLTRGRLADAGLAALVMLIIAMLIVPLPTWVLDQLIALNLALSLLLLVTSMYVPHGLSFTSMPSVLLITTLYRLALNVSSTRLILLQADAGRVIRAFGDFVVRGDYLVGAVIFLIVSLIQYIVVAKGGERVAEVAARFILDAMPGKQLAIDADLRAGALRVEAAQKRRAELERESRFYGAMDGAMKFIKGDAVASLIITAVAFFGGTAIGVWNRGMPLEASLKLYGLLAIGDGLVSQLPALVTSVAAGLTVTRVAEHEQSSLGQDVIDQLLQRPRALYAVSASLAMLALVPGLPALPFGVLVLATAARALLVRRNLGSGKTPQTTQEPAPAALLLELSPQLMAAVGPQRALTLDETLRPALQAVSAQLGVVAPSYRVVADPALGAGSFTLRLRQAPLLRAFVQNADELEHLLEAELHAQLRRRARELLSLDELQKLLDRTSQWAPNLVQSVTPRVFSLTQLAEILRRLLDEGVSIRALERILESLAGCDPKNATLDRGLTLARRALREQLAEARVEQDVLAVHLIDPMVEDALRDATQTISGDRVVALAPELAHDIVQAVRRARTAHASVPVLVTQDDVRRSLYDVLKEELPDVSVLAYTELPPNVTVERRELITVGAPSSFS